MVRSMLSSAITETPGYDGYARADIDSIMSEHEFQRTGLVNDEQIQRLGMMSGADYILIAEVALLDTEHIVIMAQILNVETAKVERTANSVASINPGSLQKSCSEVASTLLAANAAIGSARGEIFVGNDRFVGEHKNNVPHGYGTMYFSAADSRKSYEGHWNNGAFEGEGTMVWRNGERYVGEWYMGCRHGFGIHYYNNGARYEGYWLNDKRDGNGKFTYAQTDGNRLSYEGQWLNDVEHGSGLILWNNGDSYSGGFKGGKRHGRGVCTFANGDKFEGTYEDDKRVGEGVYYWSDGNKEVCNYLDDKRNGKATFYYSQNGMYETGQYEDNERCGRWEKYSRFGNLIETCKYKPETGKLGFISNLFKNIGK